MPGAQTDPPWHACPAEESLSRLDTSWQGLDHDEAGRRLASHGPNRLETRRVCSPLARFLAQFHNVLIYVLLGSALVTAGLGEWVDTSVILGIVLVNAIVGFVQEGRAERALDAIREMLSPQALVVRQGQRTKIAAEQLVPGDIVVLQAGDKVPADLRLIGARSLLLQEAALTGESEPVDKRTEPVAARAALGDRASMAYAGTLVAYGSGAGVVVATGEKTELGRITALLHEVEPLTTPLLRQMATFGRWLTAAILGFAVWTFLFGWYLRGYTAEQMFLAAVGLAVAAIPEGLPAIMTITLALGVTRMARQNAIIRRLPAVETLGSVTVICSDKTGTLTLNELTVQTVVTADHVVEVTGSGYAPEGGFRLGDEVVRPDRLPGLVEALRAGLLCNDAELRESEAGWQLAGNPTDGALLAVALKASLDQHVELASRPRTDLIPFDSTHKFMATLHHDHEGHGYVLVKGAPERILDMSAYQRDADGLARLIDRGYWHRRIEALAADAQRVIAVASRATSPEHRELRFDDVDGGLVLLGLFGLLDPPRPEAAAAIAACRAAGIRVKVITGDHAATARAIAARLGFDAPNPLSGPALDRMDAAQLRDAAREVDVFARTTPEHKLRLVEALQAEAQVVAMTGDGVNDAPALKRADVGIAMGKKGTEAAKEAAEMVLADDRFVTIAKAIEEGRTVYDNLRKTILFLLPTNGAEAVAIMTAILLGTLLPITPLQILWINMVTGVTLGLALGFEPAEADIMRRPPRHADEPLLSSYVIWRILFVSFLLLLAVFGLFLWERGRGTDLATARAVAVNMLVAGEMVYLINSRRIVASCFALREILGSRPVVIAIVLVILFQLLFTYLPPMQEAFGTAPIGWPEWARVVVLALVVFVVVEIEKAVVRHYDERAAARRAVR
jgi:magnesium-transporting ATPase (P-type)